MKRIGLQDVVDRLLTEAEFFWGVAKRADNNSPSMFFNSGMALASFQAAREIVRDCRPSVAATESIDEYMFACDRTLFKVNTPEDLAGAERLLKDLDF